MKNLYDSVKINHNPNCSYTSDHPYRILIIGGSGSGKTNVSPNLIKHQRFCIQKTIFQVKDLFKSKYLLLISGRGQVANRKFKKSQGIH